MNIYFDNAATSFPKPPAMLEAMQHFQNEVGANPGRSGHRASVEAGRILYDTRDSLARLFSVDDPLNIVFTVNATMALNMAILGLLRPGDHAVTSLMEHNSVARVFTHLEKQGIEVTYVGCDRETGTLSPEEIGRATKKNTRLIALIHASNVCGAVMPVEEVGSIAREKNIPFLVDAAQTAGAYPIDVEKMRIDLLAFPGHKSLFGPQGTGGLYVRPGIELDPLMFGGTGSRSEYEEQPVFMPDRLESGTPNTIGIAGLGAGVEYIFREGLENIIEQKKRLKERFLAGVDVMPHVRVVAREGLENGMSVISLLVSGWTTSEVGRVLDEDYGVFVRCGLHCSPSAHKTLGTFPDGTVRFSLGYFNTEDEIDIVLQALEKMAKKGEPHGAQDHDVRIRPPRAKS